MGSFCRQVTRVPAACALRLPHVLDPFSNSIVRYRRQGGGGWGAPLSCLFSCFPCPRFLPRVVLNRASVFPVVGKWSAVQSPPLAVRAFWESEAARTEVPVNARWHTKRSCLLQCAQDAMREVYNRPPNWATLVFLHLGFLIVRSEAAL